jgi:hypothetical protein
MRLPFTSNILCETSCFPRTRDGRKAETIHDVIEATLETTEELITGHTGNVAHLIKVIDETVAP